MNFTRASVCPSFGSKNIGNDNEPGLAFGESGRAFGESGRAFSESGKVFEVIAGLTAGPAALAFIIWLAPPK
jgi:hypothetical protein